MRINAACAIAAAFGLLAFTTTAAVAQDPSAEAKSLFERARDVAAEADTLRMRVKVSGTGSLGDQFMPAGEGTSLLVRVDEPFEGLRYAVQATGAGSETPASIASGQIGMLLLPDRTSWIDNRKEALVTRESPRALVEDAVTLLNLFFVEQLAAEDPFSRELAAESFEMKPDETINGVLCDVVTVTHRPAVRGRNTNQLNPSTVGTESTWWFAKSDGLPRRILSVQDAQGILVLRFTQDILDIDLNPEGVTLEGLALTAPEGYDEVNFPSARTRAEQAAARRNDLANQKTDVAGGPERRRPAPPTTPARPVRQAAPAFELATADGETVSRDSIAGRVAVLYFWGTWCVPCRTISPMISELVAEFADEPVDVFGVAIRERSLDAAVAYHEKNAYNHTMLVHPGNARSDKVARSFRVRAYPTAVVIGPEGDIYGVTATARDATDEDFVESIREHIGQALENAEP